MLCLQAWRLTGDVYSKKRGDKPWISEMYGYSFGAAKAGVWHKYDEESMLYPSYMPNGEATRAVVELVGMGCCGDSFCWAWLRACCRACCASIAEHERPVQAPHCRSLKTGGWTVF
jgi:hypothetical protein